MLTKIYSRMYQILKRLFYMMKYGDKFTYGKKFRFRDSLRINISDGTLKLGDNVFFNHDCSINVHKHVHIGDDCIFGENVKIYDHDHKYREKNMLINNQGFSCMDIVIGNNCWIGSNVIILKGTHIGNNCIIGAGVILRENVSDNSVVYCKQEHVSNINKV